MKTDPTPCELQTWAAIPPPGSGTHIHEYGAGALVIVCSLRPYSVCFVLLKHQKWSSDGVPHFQCKHSALGGVSMSRVDIYWMQEM